MIVDRTIPQVHGVAWVDTTCTVKRFATCSYFTSQTSIFGPLIALIMTQILTDPIGLG
jgi:hypothetical protein